MARQSRAGKSSRALMQTLSEGDPPSLLDVTSLPAKSFQPRSLLVKGSDSEMSDDVEMVFEQLDFMEVFSPPRVFFPIAGG